MRMRRARVLIRKVEIGACNRINGIGPTVQANLNSTTLLATMAFEDLH